ncbi:T-complex protein 1 subunit gamma [Bombus vosnesenskii]|uniref:T-complex protein 1 subunit gamma n=3 Tax=Pyrobombus TaxID=144703 RepID=A0A6J3KAD7_9HYME|nr:T-complex protein 1 subunit gamma [Bombus impatiens]XP_033206484.1 T-complex protein 1 subunit gamma [Bombus vancouverensis nearcticus]XP_033316756.1 T-complex protein 1 subunit gamma [Bombus bifarius]XP_033349009.1 T-complex protein 1 subunit gamma [Bombus vosnesenskii]XP_043583505.1 T-complex protein 1 subunit gamma [Bombus pyrosoma]XP_050496803.1 T-complex protein 1 subunit gamma [Bombus huntii]
MFGSGAAPIVVLSQNTKRDTGRKVQRENIQAGKAIADVIRTCLGPQAMLKMLMDPMGGIVMTNDGNAILREITVQHPAGKSMIEIARTQDEEVGDGTTSVIVLAGEILATAEPFLEQNMHPTIIIRAFRQALEDMVAILNEQVSIDLDCNNRSKLIQVINSCVGTKFIGRWCELACQIALDAVYTVMLEENGRKEIDIKRYAKVEKIPGGTIEDSTVLKGVMFNKDVTHPKMKRYIKNPRIVLLDCSLEYKKGESQTNIEIMKDTDFTRILELEEEFVKKMCEDIISVKPDVIITEKGVSDLAQHYLVKAGISAIRRLRKSDINRIARACGATVVNRTEELREEDVGTRAGLFEIKKLGDEYFCFITECKDPKACTIILRGASKDVLNETERNLQDALHVARNLLIEPKLVPGGGAVEMAVSRLLTEKAARLAGVEQWPYKAVAQALEIIPRTLAQNCGANTIRTLTALRAKHATEGMTWGIDGETGQLVDMKERGIWEPLSVKLQTYKTAIETAILLLRIDDIVSGSKKKKSDNEPGQPAQVSEESMKD